MDALQVLLAIIISFIFAFFTTMMTISHSVFGFWMNVTTNEQINCTIPPPPSRPVTYFVDRPFGRRPARPPLRFVADVLSSRTLLCPFVCLTESHTHTDLVACTALRDALSSLQRPYDWLSAAREPLSTRCCGQYAYVLPPVDYGPGRELGLRRAEAR